MSARAEIYWTRSSKQVGAVRQGNFVIALSVGLMWLSASGAGPKPFGSCPRAAGCRAATSCCVKVLGRRPSRTFPPARRPASENLRGTKPREGARIGRCRALSYGDLAVGGPQLRWAVRWGERWRMALQLGGKAVL